MQSTDWLILVGGVSAIAVVFVGFVYWLSWISQKHPEWLGEADDYGK